MEQLGCLTCGSDAHDRLLAFLPGGSPDDDGHVSVCFFVQALEMKRMLSDDDTTRDPQAVDARDIGGRIGFFVEWAESIESEGKNSDERRFEYRELLSEMSIHEDDLNASERKQFNQRGILASLEHDEMEDHERELRIHPLV